MSFSQGKDWSIGKCLKATKARKLKLTGPLGRFYPFPVSLKPLWAGKKTLSKKMAN